MTLVSNDNVIRFSIRCQAISRQYKIETTTVIFCQLAAELLRHWKKNVQTGMELRSLTDVAQ
jgi:hypothetical protein